MTMSTHLHPYLTVFWCADTAAVLCVQQPGPSRAQRRDDRCFDFDGAVIKPPRSA